MQKVSNGAKEPCMDLGRPVARHRIRRPHEVIDLETEITLETDVAADDEPVVDDQRLSSEPSER
jgi:hypothetical protein